MILRWKRFGVGIALLLVAGCGASQQATAPTSPALAEDDICGRAPAALEGELLPLTEMGIGTYVAADGRDDGAAPLRAAFGVEALACDMLSFRACEAAVAEGADPGLALEVHRMAMGAKVCVRAAAMLDAPAGARADKQHTPRWRPGSFMVQALSRVAAAASAAQRRGNFALDDRGSSVLGAQLAGGTSIDMTRKLQGHIKYAIVAAGSDSVEDLDIVVFDDEGQRVAIDDGDNASALVEFTPRRSGRYRIELRLSRSRTSGAFAAMSILRNGGGYRLPPHDLARSFGSALAMATIASERIAANDDELVFHANGDWAFYGAVMKQGELLALGGFDLTSSATVVLAASDGGAADIDLEVVASRTNRVMGHDRGDDNTPMVLLRPDAAGSYAVRMSTPKASKPSLVSVLVLDVRD